MKMVKHKALSNHYVIAPKLVGSMTTRGQMKPTFRVNIKVSQERTARALSLKILPYPVF